MQTERFGFRAGEFSAWHRTASLKRFMGEDIAQVMSMVDLDHALFISYADGSKIPVVLLEVAEDRGGQFKATSVLRHLAERANITAYAVLYQVADHANEADRRFSDISSFRVRRVWPDPERDWTEVSPQRWAEIMLVLRARGAARLDSEVRASRQSELPMVTPKPAYMPGTQ